MKFYNENELYNYLKNNDLSGIDSEYSLATQKLKKEFKAKEVHFNKWWVRTDPSWKCTVCRRRKSQIVKINKHGDLSGQLHEHHDHMAEFLKNVFDDISSKRKTRIADIDAEKFILRISFGLASYENTLVCSDCNKADATAKAIVKAHKYFSFSPKDIASFIIVKNNDDHEISEENALRCYIDQKDIYKRRIELASYIAEIAADNEHWYEESKINNIANINFHSNNIMERYGVHEGWLFKQKEYKKDLNKWRKRTKIFKYVPTEGDIEHMINTRGEKWNKLEDDWLCPICKRSKKECISKSKKEIWIFNTASKDFLDQSSDNWSKTKTVCDSCYRVYTLLQKEVDINNILSYTDYNVIKEDEIKKSILNINNHNFHDINNKYVESILDELKNRIEKKICTSSELAKNTNS